MRISTNKRGASSTLRVVIVSGVLAGAMLFLTIADPFSSSNLSTDLSSFLVKVQSSLEDYPSNLHSIVASNTTATSPVTLSGALLDQKIWAETVWTDLISEAANLKSTTTGMDQNDPGIFMEVGMFRAWQCLQVAEAGLQAHCVEPSKANLARVKGRIDKASEEVQRRVQLHHVAAGSVSGRTLQFHSGGGSGDRVGHVDVWKMEQNPDTPPVAMTEIKEMRMDDIVMEQPQGAFTIKIDTQGFEPHVFSGLGRTLASHKAQFILFEFWPKGMDIMTAKIGDCVSAKVLQKLAAAGYKLYQLPASAHPAAPKEWKSAASSMPLNDLAKNCQWYYDLEERFPSENYKMGYWSDVLAVAPEAKLAQPVSALGKLLFQ